MTNHTWKFVSLCNALTKFLLVEELRNLMTFSHIYVYRKTFTLWEQTFTIRHCHLQVAEASRRHPANTPDEVQSSLPEFRFVKDRCFSFDDTKVTHVYEVYVRRLYLIVSIFHLLNLNFHFILNLRRRYDHQCRTERNQFANQLIILLTFNFEETTIFERRVLSAKLRLSFAFDGPLRIV